MCRKRSGKTMVDLDDHTVISDNRNDMAAGCNSQYVRQVLCNNTNIAL